MSRRGRKNYIRRPDVVERIGSYLGTSFPLFHAFRTQFIQNKEYRGESSYFMSAKLSVTQNGTAGEILNLFGHI